MIMITDYDFLSYVIFDLQLKITFRKFSGPPEKIHSPPKNLKSASPPFLLTMKIFQAPQQKRGGGHCDKLTMETQKPCTDCIKLKVSKD